MNLTSSAQIVDLIQEWTSASMGKATGWTHPGMGSFQKGRKCKEVIDSQLHKVDKGTKAREGTENW